jgi:hypothetical protein
MDSVLQASSSIMPADRVTGLVRALVNTKALTAVLEHLRHEGKFVEASILVERAKNVLLT